MHFSVVMVLFFFRRAHAFRHDERDEKKYPPLAYSCGGPPLSGFKYHGTGSWSLGVGV